ncbi:MBL fold metallo-hydrolase [Pseudomonas boanensis]|uniref:MBL fold metallo-hydrolase n=1 Tax=Metapseudomonas boanensis TaxID=2822138 RepID=UPI0035D526F2
MPRALRPSWLIGVLSFFGRAGAPHQGPASDHFDGQRFHNIEPKPHKNLRALLRWQLTRAKQATWVDLPGPAVPPDVVERVDGDELRVTYINHATLLIQHRGLNILTDPVWSKRVSPVNFLGPRRHHPPGLPLDRLPPIDLVLVSHNHYDHLDLATLRTLVERFPLATVVTGLGNAALIRETGFKRIVELDWWQSLPLENGVLLHAVPVQHWSARGTSDTNQTLWVGFVIESPDGPVLFPGDSGLGPEFHLIRERFGPMRFAALPIGAYAPRWFMRDNHMSPDDAVQAHKHLGSRHSLAIHFGTFRLSDEGQFTPPQDLAKALVDHQVDRETFRVPTPGYQWLIPVVDKNLHERACSRK